MDFTSERYEKQHLGEVLGFVRRQTAIEEERKRVLDAEIDEMLEHYNSDNQDLHIALVVATDQQRELEGLLARFARAANSPLFGRVDRGDHHPQRIYIGRQGVFDEATQQTLVVDWRTPVANLYYDATPGPASYQSVDGEITGEMTVKRTYSIEKGEMTAFFDASGLDYPSSGPEHAYLHSQGRVHYDTISDEEAMSAFFNLSRYEGIIPAVESSHAVAYAMKLAQEKKHGSILVCLSGRGDKDLDFVIENYGYGDKYIL